MSISLIVIGDKIQDAFGKTNDLMNEILVSGNLITGDILEVQRFDSSTYQIQLPISEDKILSGLGVSITYGPDTANVAAGTYQLKGLTYIYAGIGFPVAATSGPLQNRIDIIVANTAGVLIYISGVEGIYPTTPATPANTLLIAGVYISGLGTIDTFTDASSLSAGTVIGSTIRLTGVKLDENIYFNQTGILTSISDNNVLFSLNDLTNRYEFNYNKTGLSAYIENIPSGKTSGYYFNNTYRFRIEGIDPTIDETFIDTNNFNLELNHKDIATSIQSKLILDGINTTAELAVDSNSLLLDQNRTYFNSGINLKTVSVSGVYNVLTDDNIIFIDTSGGVATINLPSSPTGTVFEIKDLGNAATNNITIDAPCVETIDGSTTRIINKNYDSITVVKSGGSTLSVVRSHHVENSGKLQVYVNNNATTTPIAVANTYTPILFTSTPAIYNTNFTVATNSFTYNGISGLYDLKITGNMTKIGPAQILCSISVFVNGVQNVNSEISFYVDSSFQHQYATQCFQQLNPGDIITVRIKNITNTDTLIVSSMNLIIK